MLPTRSLESHLITCFKPLSRASFYNAWNPGNNNATANGNPTPASEEIGEKILPQSQEPPLSQPGHKCECGRSFLKARGLATHKHSCKLKNTQKNTPQVVALPPEASTETNQTTQENHEILSEEGDATSTQNYLWGTHNQEKVS